MENQEINEKEFNLSDKFVFMDKTLAVLDIALKTEKNVILFGPGGHGKSDFTLEYLYEKGINPYVLTMGTGMTTDRLFGGFDIKLLNEEGKIEYLIENSFMNHEFVIFEELFDSPDYILEQLKDILSSGVFRNGTQVFPIKTRLIICCTNKTRAEFSKNTSLKALMERFPLEHNVIWDNYNEISYNQLLEKRFGQGNVDPIMPFILQEYAKNNNIISPRIALDAYEVFEECGPDSLLFIADFAKNPSIIKDSLSKFEKTIEFKKLSVEILDLYESLTSNDRRSNIKKEIYKKDFPIYSDLVTRVKQITINDDIASLHAQLITKINSNYSNLEDKYNALN